MVRRIRWIVGGLIAFAVAGWGITIPVTTTSNTGLTATATNTYGQITSGSLISARSIDPEWNFYTFTGGINNPVIQTTFPSYVAMEGRPPLSTGYWEANSVWSRWISPVRNPCSSTTNSNCDLPKVTPTAYLVATTFSIPAMTNPPNLSQWWLVMSGTVWADDSIAGLALYSGTSPSGTPIYWQAFAPSIAGPQNSAGFSVQTWVTPNQDYTLAFLLNNTTGSWAGFRLEWTEKYVTPEPGAWALMLSVGAGLALASWRRRKAKRSQP